MPPGYIRAIPDILGHISGKIFYLEVKKSKAEAMKKTGRIVLQRKYLEDRRKEGAFAEFVYPENHEEILIRLKSLGIT